MANTTRTRVTRTRVATPKESTPELIEPSISKKRRSLSKSTIVLGTLLVVVSGIAIYFYYKSQHGLDVASNKEIEELTATIGQFLELPVDEKPTLATVTDKEKLSDQTFFLKAENGDKVLIYSKSGKAILYRPSTRKIVDMTSVNVDQSNADTQAAPQNTPEQAAPQTTEAEAPQVTTVALYNGGTKVGVTDAAEKQIASELPGVQVTVKEKAVKSDYVGTVVVDVSGKNSDKATALASLLGAKVGSLPAGEVTPQTDIAVIIGNTEAPTSTPVPEEKKKKN